MVRAIALPEREKCTVIESFFGDVKLIKHADPSRSFLETHRFPNLKDCLDFVDRNNFEISVVHSGKGKNNKHA